MIPPNPKLHFSPFLELARHHLNDRDIRIFQCISVKQRYYCRARDADSEGLFVEGFWMNHRSVRNDGDSKTYVFI